MAKRKKVYQKFGEAAEAAQLFETALGTALLCAEGLQKGWHSKPDPDAAAKILGEIGGITLGNILRRFKNLIHIEESGIPEQFGRALKARNRLMHGFFEYHNFAIDTPDGRDQMIDDLRSLENELHLSHGVAADIAKALSDTFLEFSEGKAPDTPIN